MGLDDSGWCDQACHAVTKIEAFESTCVSLLFCLSPHEDGRASQWMPSRKAQPVSGQSIALCTSVSSIASYCSQSGMPRGATLFVLIKRNGLQGVSRTGYGGINFVCRSFIAQYPRCQTLGLLCCLLRCSFSMLLAFLSCFDAIYVRNTYVGSSSARFVSV